MNNKKFTVWLPLFFSFTMIIGMYLGYTMRDAMPGKSFFHVEKRRPVQEIIDLINDKYVDTVNLKAITDTAIQAILYKLDPHSIFIPAEDLIKVNEDLAGKFFGIGIEFSIIDDTINVTNVLIDGPSSKACVETGDKLISINDSSITGQKIDIDKIRKLLRGDKGSEVTLELLRGAAKKTVLVKRDAIPLVSVDANYIIANGIGYIKLNKFSQETYREFMRAMENMQKQGLQKLILDLRGNGGGILDNAIEIADEFLDGDKLIVYTEGVNSKKREYRCKRPGLFEKGKLVILVDELSASASEVLAGALQDWCRATIVGRRTFGKGLVQEQYSLSDGSAMRLTVARYYTPLGRSIQRSYENGKKVYMDQLWERFSSGEMLSADSIKLHNNGKRFATACRDTLFGGDGITPSVFVPIDTSLVRQNINRLINGGNFNNAVYKYYLKNTTLFEKYKSSSEFTNNFAGNSELWDELLKSRNGDAATLEKISSKEKELLQLRLKALLARYKWRNSGFFQVLNSSDASVKKALEVIAK